MKIDIVSHSDMSGGAARAAYRLHKRLSTMNLESKMLVVDKLSDDHTVLSSNSVVRKIYNKCIINFSNNLQKLQITKNPILHSFNCLGTNVFKNIQKSNSDIINLHWINKETLSIKQIANINKPIVMTLHDMWAFCGSEHLSIDSEHSLFRIGYKKNNEDSDYISGFDLNKFTWKRKKKYWIKPFTIVTPSHWLTKCARESILFSGWDIHTIPNVIDTNTFKPINNTIARKILNLPLDKKLIGFGAMGGGRDPNKGFDLLSKALKLLSDTPNYHCIVFGQTEPKEKVDVGLPINFVGHLHDDTTLSLFYNAIDVMVVPSRMENLPQTATEAQSCGTPVVAFDTTGLPDAVEHKKTGYLAEPFNIKDLAAGIDWCISKRNAFNLSINARERALRLWNWDIVTSQYVELYQKVINKCK